MVLHVTPLVGPQVAGGLFDLAWSAARRQDLLLIEFADNTRKKHTALKSSRFRLTRAVELLHLLMRVLMSVMSNRPERPSLLERRAVDLELLEAALVPEVLAGWVSASRAWADERANLKAALTLDEMSGHTDEDIFKLLAKEDGSLKLDDEARDHLLRTACHLNDQEGGNFSQTLAYMLELVSAIDWWDEPYREA